MKTRTDPRHKKRIRRFKKLFSYSFIRNEPEVDLGIEKVVSKLKKIDAFIQEAAPEWPVDRLNKVDLAILRLSVYELLIVRKTPPKVVIDEAVEIGKEYGSESTAKFVNGVLGALLEKHRQDSEKPVAKTE
ncbi:transcription antitermination factor NusB [Candidatus Beckwithbacteria bacterium]|nr:transcription antitermination factor NusB [Candidatus Beckwithbacteria bacterium]